MARIVDEFAGPARQLSGWLIPLAVFAVTAAISAVILVYYFAPGPRQFSGNRPAPTDSSNLVMLSLGNTSFHVPSNYILFPTQRSGGTQEELSLIALLPELQGYTLSNAQEFNSNAPDSRVVNMVIRVARVTLTDTERFTRVYRPLLATPEGTETEFGATRYTFRAGSGYRDEELYVGQNESGVTLIRCTRPTENVPSPSCIGDVALNGGLTVTYRFKRAYIEQWREIMSGVGALIGAFMVKA
jgi:hypothetical protein